MIGLEQYLEALAEEDAPADVAREVSRRKPVGPRRAVPHRRHATEVEELSPDYQALMTAAADAGDELIGAQKLPLQRATGPLDERGRRRPRKWRRRHRRGQIEIYTLQQIVLLQSEPPMP